MILWELMFGVDDQPLILSPGRIVHGVGYGGLALFFFCFLTLKSCLLVQEEEHL